jgi:hypothetical protein
VFVRGQGGSFTPSSEIYVIRGATKISPGSDLTGRATENTEGKADWNITNA